MALGGALSLADRRLRFGAPARAPGAPPRRPRAAERWQASPRSSRSSLFCWPLAAAGVAVQPDEVMKDPALEARARALSAELRCLVCQNQSIDDSDAPLARDIRLLIRERIAQGREQRRGARLSRLALRRFHPAEAAVQAGDLLLWLSAPLTLCAGLAAVFFARRRAPPDAGADRGGGGAAGRADEGQRSVALRFASPRTAMSGAPPLPRPLPPSPSPARIEPSQGFCRHFQAQLLILRVS